MKKLIIILCILFTSSVVLASEVVLKSGQKIEGKIVEQTEKNVKIDTGLGTPITYYLDEINSIDGNVIVVKEPIKPQTKQVPSEEVLEVKSPEINQSEVTPSVASSENTNISQEFSQKDGLFKLNIPEGWQGREVEPGTIIIVAAPTNNAPMIVIKFKSVSDALTQNEIKTNINSSFDQIIAYKIKPNGGEVIENKETTIDNVYARSLLYTVSLKGEQMYWVHIVFVNKGYSFSIDYGDFSKEQVEKIVKLFDTLRF